MIGCHLGSGCLPDSVTIKYRSRGRRQPVPSNAEMERKGKMALITMTAINSAPQWTTKESK